MLHTNVRFVIIKAVMEAQSRFEFTLTARQIKIYLKQNNLHVSGSKAVLVASALDFSHTGTRHNERNSANDSTTERLSSDSENDSDSHTSTSENNSDLDSDDSETDGFVEHSYEVIIFQTTTSNK